MVKKIVSAKANIQTLKKTTYSNLQLPMQSIKNHENQVNMTVSKETHKGLLTKPKDMEICELSKNSE